jgi:signal transduction histidine kinase
MDKDIPIITLDIHNDLDIILAHRRGMQFAKFCGIGLSEQTRFATAVSEISRNAVEYAINGSIRFFIVRVPECCYLTAVIKDEGAGITDLDSILERKPEGFRGRGLGIIFARRLADKFKITTSDKGTTVTIQKMISARNAHVSKLVVQGWLKHLEKEPVISAYEELKMRNMQLVELTEELQANAKMVQTQMDEIRELNAQLSKSYDRMKEFTYAISHDLKTPLSSLKMSSDFLEQKPKAKDAAVYKAILSRSVKRLDKTVHSLIEIIDMQERGKQRAKKLEFTELFDEAKEENEQFIIESNASVIADFNAPGICYLEAYLQSIFHNLLSNAIKYRDQSRPLSINVETRNTEDGVLLKFADNGSGMDLDMIRDRLFTPFNRFSDQTEGKGIGLYLIKGMVESNGGKVSVESQPGKGTTFTFHLVPFK